jgi:hypothetical protein
VRTPTGVAYQLSGDWLAHWAGQICFLNGQAFFHLEDTVYRVTAVNRTVDIAIVGGAQLARGLVPSSDGTVVFRFETGSGNFCFATEAALVFDYTFTFRLNGTGTAGAHWTYGFNTNCAVCEVTDNAVLQRIALPGG